MHDELPHTSENTDAEHTQKAPYQVPQMVVLDQIANKTAGGIPFGPETFASSS